MTTVPTLELRGVDKAFGPVQALSSVNLVAKAGEVTALVGDNGAGKSTLVKCIGGIHRIDAGELLFDGTAHSVGEPRDAARLGVEIVHQDLALCDNLDVVGNMFLGREHLTRLHTLDENSMETLARQALDSLSVTTIRSARQLVASLSGGQRQTVAIAKAVLWQSKIVILDEPTAALGVAQTAQVLDLVRRLAEQGVAVILVSHNMNDVLRVADSIAVLFLGRTAAQVRRAEVTQTQVVELITTGRSGALGLSPTQAGATL
ncbi:ATP-binding cassette domain-containing protein [Kribbella sp. NPDC003505]|jgi:D-xylose transport system ATP-binding protein|uniref:ATP-binding cassette domain-containing protein n=1 Tax=unclassified Kribbella TaxID=2644121 RepID=UPI0033AFE33D